MIVLIESRLTLRSLLQLAKFDFELDCESLFPGKNTFEKFISGSYAGDLVRRVILDLTKKGVIFHGKVSQQLSTYNFLTTVGKLYSTFD